jgi:hypothetical protein
MPSDFNKRILALLWTLASTVPFCRTDFKYDLSSSERKIGVALFGIFYLLKWSISIIPFQNTNVNLFESNYTSEFPGHDYSKDFLKYMDDEIIY